jgi:hypothetical protein
MGSVASADPAWWRWVPVEEAGRVRRPRSARPWVDRSTSAGFRFRPEVITVAVRWYLRYGLSYRDGELLAERSVAVDHVTTNSPPSSRSSSAWRPPSPSWHWPCVSSASSRPEALPRRPERNRPVQPGTAVSCRHTAASRLHPAGWGRANLPVGARMVGVDGGRVGVEQLLEAPRGSRPRAIATRDSRQSREAPTLQSRGRASIDGGADRVSCGSRPSR